MKFLLVSLLALGVLHAAPKQSDFYLREEIPLPPGEVMEIGSVALLPGQKVAVATRRGDIWICDGAYGADLSKVTWKKFAHGFPEPLGMYYQNDSLFLTQRPEFSRIQDSDNDGTADVFETINSDWGISGTSDVHLGNHRSPQRLRAHPRQLPGLRRKCGCGHA